MSIFWGTLLLALVLGCGNYRNHQYAGKDLTSLPEVMACFDHCKRLLQKCGFKVTAMLDPTDKDIDKFLRKLAFLLVDVPKPKRVTRNGEQGFENGVVLVVYYAGHGMTRGATTSILLKGAQPPNTIVFPLEDRIRSLALSSNGELFTIGLFDNCRTLDPETYRRPQIDVAQRD